MLAVFEYSQSKQKLRSCKEISVSESRRPSRRGFLRGVASSAVFAPALFGSGQTLASPDAGTGANAMILGRINLDRELVDQEGALTGVLWFLSPVSGTAEIRWMDSFGRVAGEQTLSMNGPGTVKASFSFNTRAALTYINWIRVTLNGTPQVVTAKFLMSPTPAPWNEYHTISWAHYTDGFYSQLRAAGLDATIAYTKDNNDPVLDNNFRFYVEQMAWEVYAIYHKDQPLWRSLLTKIRHDRQNLDLWVRNPCVNDPKTTEYLEKYITRYARDHAPFRPLFYNIADELGQGDQIRPNDFCHSEFCAKKFAEFLRQEHGQPSAVASEWAIGQEMTHWDDAVLHSDSAPTNTMIGFTTTDRAFESIALAGLRERYKTIGQFNKEWGTSFPVPRGNGVMEDSWNPILAVARESLSASSLTDSALEKQMGSLEVANARWGGLGSWNAPNEPTKFQNWGQVITFLNRFYKELGETTSTRGWNVGAWCDFRNFMDETFADAVKRAADICRAADPHALCGTEGGQSPFAFGWYNYEQVVRVLDVIEPYNIGNNVEVIRSLKPSMIMMSTHGFSSNGQALSDKERLEQKRAVRPVWWGLFHSHNATLIWDNNETENRFVNLETGKLTASAETFAPVFHELRAGIGKLMINAQRKHDGIAIHYSPASIQIHWLLENLQHAREWMLKSGGTSDSICIAVRNSWTKLIEDLGLQYNFIGTGKIEAGELASGEYKVFVMPESLAVSEQEAAQIRAFVAGGGTLLADCHAADLTSRGRDLGKGQLDDVFGISHGASQAAGTTIRGAANDRGLQLEGRELKEVRVGDTTVTTTTGKALARAGEVPMIVVNQFGAGRTIFLNMEIADYAFLRLKPGSASSLPEIVEMILADAQIKPQVRVLGSDGKRLPGTEIVRFANGNTSIDAIFRNPQFDNGGWGAYPKLLANSSMPLLDPELAGNIDNGLLEKEEQVTIEWTAESQTYDIRGRKDMGRVQTQKATLSPWEPLVFSRSTQSLATLEVKASNVRGGETLEIVLTDNGSLPNGTFRLVHLDIKTPAGDIYEAYSRNVLVKTTPHIERVPLAFNDPKGNWKVSAHDLLAAQLVETTFDLA
jgi:Beta-galactosidase trimerisation domain